MSRPADWSPLAGSDPVPGDPVQIQVISRRHAALADELATQASQLRTLAGDKCWDADAGRLFAESAREIADNLDKARRRYTAVAEALSGYAPRLEEAQREADAALQQAKSAQSTIDANQPKPSSGTAPTDAQKAADEADAKRKSNLLSGGTDDLRHARQRMNNAADHRNTQAKRAAEHIRQVTEHDDLEDSWWDKVKNWTAKQWDGFIDWVHRNAPLISKIADVCGWIATALAAVAIVLSFIPILAPISGVLLAAAAGFTVVSLIAHTMLALSGDGSWLDVGFDVIGLVTFGYGKVAAKGLQAGEQALKLTATRAARKAGEKAIRAAAREGGTAVRTAGSKAARAAASSATRKAATRAAKSAVATAEKTGSTLGGKVLTLDGQAAQALSKTNKLAQLAGNSPRALQQAANVTNTIKKVAVSGAIGIGSDVADKSGVSGPVKPALTFGRYAR